MSILKVNKIQPFSGTKVSIVGNSSITGSFTGSFFGSLGGAVPFADITGKPTLISGSDQLAGTTVNGSLTVNNTFSILSASHAYSQNTDADTGTETVATIATGSSTAAFFDYVVTSGSNARAGTVMTTWNGGNITYADTSTADIGSTTSVDMTTAISSGNVLLRVTTTTNNWSVKTVSRIF